MRGNAPLKDMRRVEEGRMHIQHGDNEVKATKKAFEKYMSTCIYLLHQFLHFTPERIFFPLRRNREVDFLLRGGFDVGLQIEEVGGGLKVDSAMVRVHYLSIFVRSALVLSGSGV